MNASFLNETPTAGRRIMALWLPYLPTERLLRQRLGRSWRSRESREPPAPARHAAGPDATRRPPPGEAPSRKDPAAGDGVAGDEAAGAARAPLVVSCREANAQRIMALDEKAEALGLKPGMGIADARAMHPGIEIVEGDPAADRRLLEGLADWCDRYTPLVALDGEDGLFLDITGCAHLFGGEAQMLADIVRRLFGQGFDARAGIASTPGAAWAAARFIGAAPIGPGAEAAALAPLPLAALRLEAPVRAGLESVGLRDAGAVMAAPRAPLARRFGRGLLLRLDQALGRVEEAVSPRRPVPPLSVERALAEPVGTVEAIEDLVLALARSLEADLERRGEGARRLQLSLFRVDGAVTRHGVGTSRPMREPRFVQRLFRERLAAAEGLDAGYGFELVRLSVTEAAPFEIVQGDLAGAHGRPEEDLALFADRLQARLGTAALMRPVPVESHLPERAALLVPFAADAGALPAAPTAPERPIRLLARPEPVEVIASEVPEGPPLNFRWRRTLHRVLRSEGPERIAPEWWREPEATPTRDYFHVEDEAGRRYWLFREGLYGAVPGMPRWFMHGIFA